VCSASFFQTRERGHPKLTTPRVEKHIKILDILACAQPYFAVVCGQPFIRNSYYLKIHLLLQNNLFVMELKKSRFVFVRPLKILQSIQKLSQRNLFTKLKHDSLSEAKPSNCCIKISKSIVNI
jgi:hypothetical protein